MKRLKSLDYFNLHRLQALRGLFNKKDFSRNFFENALANVFIVTH